MHIYCQNDGSQKCRRWVFAATKVVSSGVPLAGGATSKQNVKKKEKNKKEK